MAIAFQPSAFQNTPAFQTVAVAPVVAAGGYAAANMFTFPPIKQDDDDLLLAAWFMFMSQPYEN